MKKLLTLKKAAHLLDINIDTLRAWNRNGALPFVKIGPPKIDYLGRDRRAVRVSEENILSLITKS